MTKMNTSLAQNYGAQIGSGAKFQNVKTQTINVGGTDLLYKGLHRSI